VRDEHCKNEDKKKVLEYGIKSKQAELANLKDNLDIVITDMEKINSDMVELDKTVGDATEQRKKENAAYTEMLSDTSQAIEILEVAKNRLEEFYPASFVQRRTQNTQEAPSFLQEDESDDSAEDEDSDEYDLLGHKKRPQSGGRVVIDLITKIQQDLKDEFQTAKTEEESAQKDYEELLVDAKKRREVAARSLTEKEGVKAGIQEDMKRKKDRITGLQNELAETIDVLADLHKECDWILANFLERIRLRAAEVEGLQKCKAVLAGTPSTFTR